MNPEQFLALRQHRLLATLGDGQFAHIGAASQCLALDAGQMLFQRGSPARHFYVVTEGQIKLCLQSRSGDEKIVEIVSTGQSFAEALMFAESPAYPVAAIALLATTVIAIPNTEYLDVLRSSTATCFRLLADLSWRLHAQIREIETLSFENARNRVINHLLGLSAQAVDGATVTLAESKQALAARLAIQPETLSRTLRALSEAGAIQVEGRQIRIIDAVRLRQPA